MLGDCPKSISKLGTRWGTPAVDNTCAGAGLGWALQGKLAPGLISAVLQRANFERRQGARDAACSVFNEALEKQSSAPDADTYPFLVLQYAAFLVSAFQDAAAARAVYTAALAAHPSVRRLWEVSAHLCPADAASCLLLRIPARTTVCESVSRICLTWMNAAEYIVQEDAPISGHSSAFLSLDCVLASHSSKHGMCAVSRLCHASCATMSCMGTPPVSIRRAPPVRCHHKTVPMPSAACGGAGCHPL